MHTDLKVERVSGLGEILRFRRSPLAYVADIARRSVDIRHIRVLGRDLFLVNNPELIRDVLVTNDWNFVKGRGLRASKPVLGNGLLTSEGELHRRQRRLAQPGFSRERLVGYAKDMVDCAVRTSAIWQEGTVQNINEEMTRLTLQIVTRCLFSADVGQQAQEVSEALTAALRPFVLLTSPLVQGIAPLRKVVESRVRGSRRKLDKVLQTVIAEHRAHPEQYDDMLTMLMGARDEATSALMSDELLRDEAMTLFLAGHETTANGLVWTWYLLSQTPEMEQKMSDEIQQLDGRLPGLDDLPRLRHTEAVFREALRLYPPAWVISREAVTDCQLGAIAIPAGATLILSPYATQRDPRFWGNPEAFDPTRWSDTTIRPKFSYFPFGAGTRVCIGEHFAMMEGVLVLATIAQRWRLHLRPEQKVVPLPQITLRPRHPMRFRITTRFLAPGDDYRAEPSAAGVNCPYNCPIRIV